MSQFLEMCMVLCFGISWPVSIIKSYKTRSTKGKSLVFLIFITLGYVCGVTSKFIAGKLTYVVVFYIINLIMLIIELLLYVRNYRLDRSAAKSEAVPSAK